ncbi:50S ribosomal protein L9 [Glutamicibacter soli]|uniref:Large ribosomal subunit protein bL9 n=1 Tax=Glutamicibacter soli TaxID=453836 RepID=A0A365YER0_9MICC|nr:MULTISPECIES: 50S ribosomal protein L9 [Micrococcaceae]ALD65403.1 50S ribosomal protein L9 [Arthrobacter sp. LS16]ALQ29231.1 50S ribosomal protein L9 [Arthrobacter sp. YC-RL1]KLI89373.1 50S ribosomal protein L9 [Arthrobacter sp. YC-RL1]NAZ16225.1 50S ribosomal protein L9 [Glutamicibacter soli]RBM01088.1 50S ribosomal protein L9 [Glutamicibacter soli]
MAKIILTHEVSGLGAAGDIVEVKNGYARNYLLPRGFAIVWTQGGEKQVDSIKAARAARAVANLEEAQALAASLKSQPVKVTVKAGANGRLFGTVKTADIAAAVANAGLGKIDKRNIEVSDHIKSTGNYTATVRVHEDVVANLRLQVVAAAKK